MIRGGADADADADYVEKLAESLRVPVTIERVDVPGGCPQKRGNG